MTLHKWFWLACTVLCMAGIFAFSAQPATDSSQASRAVTQRISKVLRHVLPKEKTVEADFPSLHKQVRKASHFILFLVLGLVMYTAFHVFFPQKTPAWLFWTSASACLLYALSDELHQTFVPGRAAQLSDVALDLCGSLCGIGFMHLLRGRKRIKEQ